MSDSALIIVARSGEDRLRDALGVVGVEGQNPHLDQMRAAVVGDADHPLPVIQQILDRARGGVGEDRIARRLRPDRAQIEFRVYRGDEAGAVHVFVEDIRIG